MIEKNLIRKWERYQRGLGLLVFQQSNKERLRQCTFNIGCRSRNENKDRQQIRNCSFMYVKKWILKKNTRFVFSCFFLSSNALVIIYSNRTCIFFYNWNMILHFILIFRCFSEPFKMLKL